MNKLRAYTRIFASLLGMCIRKNSFVLNGGLRRRIKIKIDIYVHAGPLPTGAAHPVRHGI